MRRGGVELDFLTQVRPKWARVRFSPGGDDVGDGAECGEAVASRRKF